MAERGITIIDVVRGKDTLHIEVAQQRTLYFETHHGQGSLKRLFEMLVHDQSSSFTEMARRFGIREQSTRRIYSECIAPAIGEMSVRQRRRAWTIKKTVRHTGFFPHVIAVWRRARRENIEVHPVLSFSGKKYRGVKKIELFLNGKLCRIYTVTHPSQVSKTPERNGMTNVHSFIFVVGNAAKEQDFFIMPSSALPASTSLYFPVRKNNHRIRKNVGDRNRWNIYLNAWHLLKE